MPTLVTTSPFTSSAPRTREIANDLLSPLFERATRSESLLASRHLVTIGGVDFDLPKFMLLGQRGGGQPIRLGILAGLDPDSVDGIAAVVRFLAEKEHAASSARDYALFAYPLVNVVGYEAGAETFQPFSGHAATEPMAGVEAYFAQELQRWAFDGVIALRTDPRAVGFSIHARSEVIAREVGEPSAAAAGATVRLSETPVAVRRPSRRLMPPPPARPAPFELELLAPGLAEPEPRIQSLHLALNEVLRSYRKLAAHAPNL